MKNKARKKIKIPSAGPSITNKEVRLVTEAVRKGWYEKRNLHIDQFIKEFSAYVDVKYCLPVSHGTSALHLALVALNIGPGDEVIVPDITWVASASCIHYVGAKPVFADIDREDWCLDPKSFEKAITKKTKAVIVVDLLGNMPSRMAEIVRIAKKHNLAIVEDAAENLGGYLNGKMAGAFGDIGAFSFSPTKLMTSGQGGAFVTNKKELYDKAKLFFHHGIDLEREGKYYWSYEIGLNYQWTNMQAALALGQLRRIDELIEKKKLLYRWYKERLGKVEGVWLNPEREGNTYWITAAIISSKYNLKKEEIIEKMKKYNIDIRPFFYPLSSMPAFSQYVKGKDMRKINPVAYEISPYGINLPYAFSLKKSDVDYVCKALIEILK
jgi:perosamine synthetase